MVLLTWYLVLCFIAMPLDARQSRRARGWRERGDFLALIPPVFSLVWMIGGAVFMPMVQSAEDLALTRQWFAWWKSLDDVGLWTVGLIIAAPVLWQAAGAQSEWQERRRQRGGDE